jgi:hypothetical protein
MEIIKKENFYYIVACSAAWNISLFAQPAASSSPAPRLMSPLYRPSSSFTPSRSSHSSTVIEYFFWILSLYHSGITLNAQNLKI